MFIKNMEIFSNVKFYRQVRSPDEPKTKSQKETIYSVKKHLNASASKIYLKEISLFRQKIKERIS